MDGCEYKENHLIVKEADWGLNLSGLFTLLVKKAGTLCEAYASDVLYDIDEMKADLRNAESFRKSKRFSKGPDGTERLEYVLGFRPYGVDHKEFVDVREVREYCDILRIAFEFDGRRTVTASVGRYEKK